MSLFILKLCTLLLALFVSCSNFMGTSFIVQRGGGPPPVEMFEPPVLRSYDLAYYVDSVTGSDSNNGLTKETAFATIEYLLTVLVDDTKSVIVWLAAGSQWDGVELHLPNFASSTVAAYGPVADGKPIIDGRVVMPAGEWTKTGGQTNVYQWDYIALNNSAEQHNIWENGIRLVRAASIGACDSTPGSYYVPPESSFVLGNPVTFYVHTTASNSPASNGLEYKTQGVEYAIQIGSTTALASIVKNIEVMGGSHHNGNIQIGRDGLADSVVSRWGTIHSLYLDSGYFTDCVSYDCEQGFDFVANKAGMSDGSIIITNCVAALDDTVAIIPNPGFFIHGDRFAVIKFIDCTSLEHAIGFATNGCPNGQTVDCTRCTAISSAVHPDQEFHAYDFNTSDASPSNSSIISITDCLGDGFGMYFWGYNLTTHVTVTIVKWRYIQRKAQACMQYRNASADISYGSAYAVGGIGYSGLELVTDVTVAWNHNIVDGCGNGTEQFGTITWNADSNVWHTNGTTGPDMRVSGTSYANFAAYDAAWETATSNADPLWVEAPHLNYNFNVQAGSPADTLSAGYTHAP